LLPLCADQFFRKITFLVKTDGGCSKDGTGGKVARKHFQPFFGIIPQCLWQIRKTLTMEWHYRSIQSNDGVTK